MSEEVEPGTVKATPSRRRFVIYAGLLLAASVAFLAYTVYTGRRKRQPAATAES